MSRAIAVQTCQVVAPLPLWWSRTVVDGEMGVVHWWRRERDMMAYVDAVVTGCVSPWAGGQRRES